MNNEEKIIAMIEEMNQRFTERFDRMDERMDRMETDIADIKLTAERIDFTTRRTWTHLIRQENRLYNAEEKLKEM